MWCQPVRPVDDMKVDDMRSVLSTKSMSKSIEKEAASRNTTTRGSFVTKGLGAC
jgi:hypothetical protein